MEFANRRLRVVVVALGLLGFTGFGCIAQKAQKAAPPATNEVLLKTPTREILVTDGDFNKPYDILGEVECTLTGKSIYLESHGSSKEIKDMLRKVAFTKYGERVGAIINTKTIESIEGGYWGMLAGVYGAKTATVSAHGIAVHLKETKEIQPAPKKLSKEDIRKLQERLTELGYSPGPVDGMWGKKTEAALKKFQEEHGLSVTGKFDTETTKKLSFTLQTEEITKEKPED